MKILKLLTLIFFLGWVNFSRAEDIDVLQVESRMEMRLTQLLKSVDPQGQVVVKAILKKPKSILPGVTAESIEFLDPGKFKKIQLDGIQEFQIIVLSSLDQLPSWLKEQMELTAEFQGVKKNTIFKKVLTTPESGLQNYQKMLSQWQNQFEDSMKKSFWGLVGGLSGLILGLFVLILVIASSFRKAVRDHIQGLQSVSENLSSSGGLGGFQSSSRSQVRDLKSDDGDRSKDQSSYGSMGGELEKLSESSLISLFSDCYWSQEDRYASWIWQSLSEEQRQGLLKKIPYAFNYASFIYSIPAEKKNYHQHPSYTKTLPTSLVSNKDLKSIIQKRSELWGALTPIRQWGLNLSLKERIEFDKKWADKKSKDVAFDLAEISFPVSTQRLLPINWEQIDVSLSDEVYLLSNYLSIEDSQKKSILSLVWLALLDLDSRKEILNQFSSEDLAMAWIGPDEVLGLVAEALPQRKLQMVKEFSEKIKPNRSSWVMQEICRVSLSVMQQKNQIPQKEKNAA